jgi:type II secretory pathway pseudopilin PulG
MNETEAGYNLIGVSLFIVVLGILTTAGIGLKQQYDWAQRQDITTANMALVKEALARFQSQHGRLPCPASLTAPPGSPEFGKEAPCTAGPLANQTFQQDGRDGRKIRYGAVPVRTLGMTDSMTVDGWSHRLVYALTEYYALGMPDFDSNNGAIKVVDDTGNSATNHSSGNVIYTVMSPGADTRGAYTLAGTLIEPCTTGTNCLTASGGGNGTQKLSMFRQYGRTSNDFTATMAYAASTVSYEWRAGDWGTGCNCNNPVQTRTASCYERGTNTVVAATLCAASARPTLTQSCAAFCWTAGPWPACPSACDQPASTVSRAVDCLENNRKNVPESLCLSVAVKPPTTQGCPATGACDPCANGGCGGGGDGGGYETHLDYIPGAGWVHTTVDRNGPSPSYHQQGPSAGHAPAMQNVCNRINC